MDAAPLLVRRGGRAWRCRLSEHASGRPAPRIRAGPGPLGPALSGARPQRHLLNMDGAAVSARPLRSQAEAAAVRRSASSRRRDKGRALRLHPRAARAAGLAVQVSEARASGIERLEFLPHLAGVVDGMAVVRSVITDQFNHAPAQIFMATGLRPVRPARASARGSPTAWAARTRTFPAYVVLMHRQRAASARDSRCWGSGFLPDASTRASQFRNQGDPVLYLSNPDGVDRTTRRRDRSTPSTTLERVAPGRRRATRRSPPGSPPTRWPSGCRPACRS